MTKEIDLLQGYANQQRKEQIAQEIFNALIRLVASNYTSTVQGPYYTIQFKTFSDFLAEIQVSSEVLADQAIFSLVSDDFLQQMLGILLLPNGEVLEINNLSDYKYFLTQFLNALLEGARQNAIEGAIQNLSEDSVVTIVDRLSGNLEDSFFVDVYISPKTEGAFPENFYALRKNIDIVINALKPAHLIYEYQNLFKEPNLLTKGIKDTWEKTEITIKYQQDMRKNFLGAKFLTGSCTLNDSHTLQDNLNDFTRVRPGSYLQVKLENTTTWYQFIIKSKTLDSLTITTWFPSSFKTKKIHYQIELDELGQIEPRLCEEMLLTDANGVAYTSFGPLVRAAGDEKLAELRDIQVITPGRTLTALDPYTGKLKFDNNTPQSILVKYYWYPNPLLAAGKLNSGGLVLNKWGDSRGASSNLNRFPFRYGINSVKYPQPLTYSPRYIGILKEGSTTLNNNLAKLNSMTLNRYSQGSSNDYLYANSFKTLTYTPLNKLINLKEGGITVESIKDINPNTNFKFDKENQLLTVDTNNPYTITFMPGLPVTRRFLLEQPLYESAEVLYGGTVPFFEGSNFSRVDHLEVSNAKADPIDDTLLQFFSDGVLKSDGFVGLELTVPPPISGGGGSNSSGGPNSSGGFAEFDILKRDITYTPLYLWDTPGAGGKININYMEIPVDQTKLFAVDSPVNNTLTRLTDPQSPQVKVTIDHGSPSSSSTYVIS